VTNGYAQGYRTVYKTYAATPRRPARLAPEKAIILFPLEEERMGEVLAGLEEVALVELVPTVVAADVAFVVALVVPLV